MTEETPTAHVTPEDYEHWRRSALGSIAERREVELIIGLAAPMEGRRLLDVGCGDGTHAIEAARRGARVTGVDADRAMIDAAARRALEGGVSIDLGIADVRALPFGANTFDLVTAVTVLCFVPDATGAIREMARVLTPGGRLVVGELNRWSTWAAWRRLRAWFGPGIWRQAVFRSPRQLSGLIRRAGLEVIRTQGAVYFPPAALPARLLAPADSVLGALTTAGAAFVAACATKRTE